MHRVIQGNRLPAKCAVGVIVRLRGRFIKPISYFSRFPSVCKWEFAHYFRRKGRFSGIFPLSANPCVLFAIDHFLQAVYNGCNPFRAQKLIGVTPMPKSLLRILALTLALVCLSGLALSERTPRK